MKKFVFTATIVLCSLLATSAFAVETCKSATFLVPALFNQPTDAPPCNGFSYSVLIAHNVDPNNSVTLDVEFLDPDGATVHSYATVVLGPFGSATFFADCATLASLTTPIWPWLLSDGRPKFLVEVSMTGWTLVPSIQAAAGIVSTSGHSENLSKGIIIGGQCR